METYSSDALTEVCELVEAALRSLPEQRSSSSEEFFAPDNLWRTEIEHTCVQAIEYFRAIMSLLDQRLNRPATALVRSIHELAIRFVYLADHQDELSDWVEWQMSRDYHLCLEAWRYDPGPKKALESRMRMLEGLLGEKPKKPSDQWKAMAYMLRDITRNQGAGTDLWFRRHFVAYPSQYVHMHAIDCPTARWTGYLAVLNFVGTVSVAMKLSVDKGLMSPTAAEISERCDQLSSVM